MIATPTERLKLPLRYLDTLWLQITGTVCNIACRHCFISCGPKVKTHDLLSVADVEQALEDARGVREVWFTGGEPLIHPEILTLIDEVLAVAPLGILTNGMLIDAEMADALAARALAGPYNLEIRVSLDGCTAEANDRIRGRGVFAAATNGIRLLAERGVDALVAVSLLEEDTVFERDAFIELLRGLGVKQPRVKWIPPFRIGREARRGRGYEAQETLTEAELTDPETPFRLQCGTSRTVTSQGVFPCPILINDPSMRLGARLSESLEPHPVDKPACHTCWVEGFSCST